MKSIPQPVNLMFGLLMMTWVEQVQAQEIPKAEAVREIIPNQEAKPNFDQDHAVISHTGQFKISGGNPAVRGTAANLAEEIKFQLLKLCESKDAWKVPVTIELRGEFGDPVPLRSTVIDLWYNETGYQVKIFVNLSRGLQRTSFDRAVISSWVLAQALKDSEKIDAEVPLSVPPWLIEGLLESVAWNLGQSDRRLYDALFEHGGLFELEDLFALSEAEMVTIDAASKAAFRVSSGALVMALIEQPEGKAGMRALLENIPSYEGEIPSLLRQHFPSLNLSQTSLTKWWALQLASKGSAPLTEVIGVKQTERALERALQLRYRDSKGELQETPFLNWPQIDEISKAEKQEAVRLAEDDLVRLSYRCFPSYRPILKEYQLHLTKWVNGETEGLSKSLSQLAETRATKLAKSERARDFLDWFEITRARETSGVFDDYLSLKARLKAKPNDRRDSISKYLDRLDPLFALPEKQEAIFPFGGGE